MISAWRITKQKNARTAFTGDGAKLYGGRWNSPGLPVIYTAESRALALAEILVHLESSKTLSKYVVFQVEINDAYVTGVAIGTLPKSWRSEPAPKRLQEIGDAWLRSCASAVLRVPCAIVPGEFNYLLNPLHRDFSSLHFHGPEKFPIDQRLLK